MKKPATKPTSTWGKMWYFLWHDDSLASWLVNIVLAFLLIRFVFYPLLGVVLGTPFPIVAVVSESMEHGLHNGVLCGESFSDFKESFDNYWDTCGSWYVQNNISKEQFETFPLASGFNKGDVILLWRANQNNLKVGDVLVFQANKAQPIIHRVVKVWQEDTTQYYQTKGDHNSNSITGGIGEDKINSQRIYGKGVVRIPYLGWVKILFVNALRPFGIIIER
ncbi:signal peptidase I [Candidatus Woesearchaeota archaeon]|nr:signal peptidase I [Candidatus Woesearchaeota archaeon]